MVIHIQIGFKLIFCVSETRIAIYISLCLNCFHLLVRKPNLEKCSNYSNNFFHNFHLSESSFTCPGLRVSVLARRLKWEPSGVHISPFNSVILEFNASTSSANVLIVVNYRSEGYDLFLLLTFRIDKMIHWKPYTVNFLIP